MQTARILGLFNKYRELQQVPIASRVDDNLKFYHELFGVLRGEEIDGETFESNLHITSPCGETMSLVSRGKFDICLYTEYINTSIFDDFIFGKISFSELLSIYCEKVGIGKILLTKEDVSTSLHSWETYLNHIGYSEEDLIVPTQTSVFETTLRDRGAVWCYNKSCSGKTFTAIMVLKKIMSQKLVYNPCYSSSSDYNFIKLILAAGKNCSLLIDDIQCDPDKAKELMDIVCFLQNDLLNRNIKVFFVSWTSLYEIPAFRRYIDKIPAFKTSPDTFLDLLKMRIANAELNNICGDNVALLNAAVKIGAVAKKIKPEYVLFKTFVHASEDIKKITQIYKLCVLGSYEYEPRIDFIGSPELTNADITTLKKSGNVYHVGHRQICAFIVSYLENNVKYALPSKHGIIRDWIISSSNEVKWRLLKQLIGENNDSELIAISPIFGALHEFEREIMSQTQKDPTWQNAPASMYFVLSAASLLGVADEYKDVLSAFCNNFSIINNQLCLKYDQLKTTDDFIIIRDRMIMEDETTKSLCYESGNDLDCNLIHKNWVLGLIVGLRYQLEECGYKEYYESAVHDLTLTQNTEGYWYPRRVPWVTARILIGLSRAGYTYSNPIVKKGVDYLLTILDGTNYWEAHTGGWNTAYETSALCLDAIMGSGYHNSNDSRIEAVKNYLEDESEKWMTKDHEIDGCITACVLLKHFGIKGYFINYINDLCQRHTFSVIQETDRLDYNTHQNCHTTQIAFFAIELCWAILEQDLPNLLREYITRSRFDKKEESKMKKVFISYCDEGKAFVDRLRKIVDRLTLEGYQVYFYADAPIGTNNVDFMRNIELCDLTIIMGTPRYKEKATATKAGGVTFEDLIISSAFMTDHRESIIPIAFDSFEKCIPAPLNTNKGITCHRVDKKFLDNIVEEINKKAGGYYHV